MHAQLVFLCAPSRLAFSLCPVRIGTNCWSNKCPFFARSCTDPIRIFGHIGQDKRAIPLLFSLCWEYVTNITMICMYQKKSQSSRHLLQSPEGSSLVIYTCTFRLWLLLYWYDHELRFTCTRTLMQKSTLKIWNWIWPVNGLCDLY